MTQNFDKNSTFFINSSCAQGPCIELRDSIISNHNQHLNQEKSNIEIQNNFNLVRISENGNNICSALGRVFNASCSLS
jgi:hypothetical protein